MTPKQQRFVEEYLVDLNGTQAAIRAGYSERTAAQIAEQNLRKLEIAQAVSVAIGNRSERTEITADRVLQELWAIATADPNELIQWRRGPCEKCWGVEDGEDIDQNADPDPNCARCGGEGRGRGWVADTRKLKGAAKKLYAGVKITKDGIEVKMHDKASALVHVGKHLGMFIDKIEHSGTVDARAILLKLDK